MFLLLQNNEVVGFWGNKDGDVFVENTIKNLKLDRSVVKLLLFSSLESVPELHVSSGNDLIVQKRGSVSKEVQVTSETGEVSTQVVQEEVIEDDYTLNGEVYFDSGIALKPC